MATPARLRDEALLYLEWVRGAAGRFAPGEPTLAPAGRASPVTAPAGGSEPAGRGTCAGSTEGDAAPLTPAGEGAWEAAPVGGLSGGDDPLDRLRHEALECQRCPLARTRTQVVFGEGARRPRLMVVGEAPGADEDVTGRPFVGRAGQLLTRMLAAIGLAREAVYIGNVLKCRPPGNRPPAPDEMAACRPFLTEQVRLLDPALILVLGNHASRALLGTDRGITSLRGQILTTPDGRRVLPTFHPAYLLRNPAAKREAWLDLQLAAKTLGLPPPPRPSADGGDA